jgi:single-stranded-DNA-specific exonuclease
LEIEKNLLAYSPLVRQLLYGRGIVRAEEAEEFLNPHYENHSHDPFSMKDMEKAVTRILKAIQEDERIAIFSDYDADGIPGAVVLHDFFKRIGYLNFENYIPDRHGEGFGLNNRAVEQLHNSGIKLLITIDCGITDVEEVRGANEFGLDVIITDHHLPPTEGMPSAYAILNPKQTDCLYPEKMLCGSGVVFKTTVGVLSGYSDGVYYVQHAVFTGTARNVSLRLGGPAAPGNTYAIWGAWLALVRPRFGQVYLPANTTQEDLRVVL